MGLEKLQEMLTVLSFLRFDPPAEQPHMMNYLEVISEGGKGICPTKLSVKKKKKKEESWMSSKTSEMGFQNCVF